eukprot:CAMPEP_0115212282 /NCGR_PEP_ID=MMETSP0270-20121206/23196_1 /TAXON_ID=71861 /ORGANISM="Scrippsiella trochoidea, Strain CCMP3099" /LENGTH=65 /DNA_ID=CAMNT_0002625991 /DNA_START=453 /DNA_END=650 /DNA_ORIENTATION=+
MHAENLVVDDGHKRQLVEDFYEEFPHLDVITPLALIVEAVYPRDRSALMVPTQHEKVLMELDLVD